MNGVVTYARKGTVVKANAFVFDDPSLDDQGRCVMTDHGAFVVFNVYVPASGGHSMTKKMHFLQSLRRNMQEQRQVHKKAVMLVGDLNISHGVLDVDWKNRVLHVEDILEQVQRHTAGNTCDTTANTQTQSSSSSPNTLPAWKVELAKAWPLIVETMKTKKVVPTQTCNSLTGAKYDRFRLCVTMDNPTRTIYLGKHESSEDYCYCGYDFAHEGHYLDPDTDKPVLGSQPNVVLLHVLQELMSKIARVVWTDQTLREISNTPDAGRQRIHPPRQWLTKLLEEDDMVDTFRHLYPTAEARFTCWYQFTNTRYSNAGTRIDYTLVDRSLLPFLKQGGTLRTGEKQNSARSGALPTAVTAAADNNNNNNKSETTDVMDPLTEQAALAAATARGHFQPVSFEGGGIVEATQHTLDTQFGPRHTGMIYTPPSFSDHIAISLLLGDSGGGSENNAEDNASSAANQAHWKADNWGTMVLDEKDPATKKSQPQKAQKSISSFFSNNATTTGSAAKVSGNGSMTSARTKLPQKRPPTMRSFFQPKESSSDGSSQNVAPNLLQRKNGTANEDERRIKSKVCATKNSSKLAKSKKPDARSILSHFAKK